MKPSECYEFSPNNSNTFCVCGAHYINHTDEARSRFMRNAPMKKVLQVSQQSIDDRNKCKRYWPSKDFVAGKDPAPDCANCGCAPRIAHTASVILTGVQAWRRRDKPACENFWGSINSPGRCGVCFKPWIEHEVKPLVIEAFDSAHKDWCKCLHANNMPCSCMDHQEIQAKLDAMEKDKTMVQTGTPCKQFKPVAKGNAMCQCGSGFYVHNPDAIGYATSYYTWQQQNLTNEDLVAWFLALPGNTRAERINALKKLLTDPQAKPPSTKLTMPSLNTIDAMIDALDTSSHLVDKERDATLVLENMKEDTEQKVVTETTGEKGYYCHSCGEETADWPGSICDDCDGVLSGQKRSSSDRGGS